MIEVQDLTKYYGPHLAVSRLDFQVAAGEIVGFWYQRGRQDHDLEDPGGSFWRRPSGTARINGYSLVSESLAVRRSLGYVPENVSIYPDLTVTQFLRFAARAKGVEPKAEKADRLGGGAGWEVHTRRAGD